MAKKITPQQWLDRAITKLGSVKAVAQKTGRCASTLYDIRSGKRPGVKLGDTLRDVAKGKRAIAPPPLQSRKGAAKSPAAPAKPVKAPVLTREQKAEEKLKGMYGTDKVVITLTDKKTGVSKVLGSHGGIKVDTILSDGGGVGGFVSAQADSQGYGDDEDGSDIFEDYVVDFEEYY